MHIIIKRFLLFFGFSIVPLSFVSISWILTLGQAFTFMDVVGSPGYTVFTIIAMFFGTAVALVVDDEELPWS